MRAAVVLLALLGCAEVSGKQITTKTDTVFVLLPCARPSLWPIQAYTGGTNFGDSASVTTFSLQTGQRAVSKVFIPGVLTELAADTTEMPKITFAPFPAPKAPSLFYRLKLIAVGFSVASTVCSLTGD